MSLAAELSEVLLPRSLQKLMALGGPNVGTELWPARFLTVYKSNLSSICRVSAER